MKVYLLLLPPRVSSVPWTGLLNLELFYNWLLIYHCKLDKDKPRTATLEWNWPIFFGAEEKTYRQASVSLSFSKKLLKLCKPGDTDESEAEVRSALEAFPGGDSHPNSSSGMPRLNPTLLGRVGSRDRRPVPSYLSARKVESNPFRLSQKS